MTWAGKPVNMPEMIEYLADVSPIGTEISIGIQKGNRVIATAVKLVPYYESFRSLIISIFVGLTVFAVGVFTLLTRPQDVVARALHWSLITLATTIMITWGAVESRSIETYLAPAVWFVTYLGVSVALSFSPSSFQRNDFRGWANSHGFLCSWSQLLVQRSPFHI